MTGGFAVRDRINPEIVNKIGEETYKNFIRRHLEEGTGSIATHGISSSHSSDEGLVGKHVYRTG